MKSANNGPSYNKLHDMHVLYFLSLNLCPYNFFFLFLSFFFFFNLEAFPYSACSATYRSVFAAPFPKLIYAGLDPTAIPLEPIKPFHPGVVGSGTGPNAGIRQLKIEVDEATHEKGMLIAGVSNWRLPIKEADGESITLYEHNYLTTNHCGDPIADIYAFVARPNNAILAVADGCNWGPKPRQAARCAARGSIEYLNQKLFDSTSMPHNTQELIRTMLRSFHSAQKMIIQNDGTTTTLCIAVVCELAEPKGDLKWGLCVVSVGDSPCFVWQNKTGLVHEVTSAAHEGRARDMRDSGGCLGTNCGSEPDLSNLICCFVPVSEGDIVFLTSDGISDNFDPIVMHEGTVAPEGDKKPQERKEETGGLPSFNAKHRQARLLTNISELLQWTKFSFGKDQLDATDVKEAITSYVIDATTEKRSFLEKSAKDLDNPALNGKEKRDLERGIQKGSKSYPGKLDHATIAAYKVGPLVGRPQAVEQTAVILPSRMREAMATYTTIRQTLRAQQNLYIRGE